MYKPVISALFINTQDDATAAPRKTWLDFPATPDELDAAMRRIGLEGSADAGYCVSKYKTGVIGLADLLPKQARHAELNRLAEAISGMDKVALYRFSARVQTDETGGGMDRLLACAEHLNTGRGGRGHPGDARIGRRRPERAAR